MEELDSYHKYCQSCGEIIRKEAEICPKCGVRVNYSYNPYITDNRSAIPGAKQRIAYILLGFFFGTIGIHDFYAGYTNKGVTKLLITLILGWVFGLGIIITGIWTIIDIITVTVDANGNPMY